MLLVFICFSCSKDQVGVSYYWGEASALRNGEHWEPKAYLFSRVQDIGPGYFEVTLNWFHPVNGFLREGIGLSKIDVTRLHDTIVVDNSYFLDVETGTSTGFYGTVLDHGDVGGDIYMVLESEENFLIVTDWNAENEEIWGVFQVTFVFAEEKHETPDIPDTLRFTNGVFHTKTTL